MPITWITSLIGSLALIGTPFLSGFFSKESIIEAVSISNLPGSGFAYFAVVAGVFVTAFYSFRMYFLVFHGKERYHEMPRDEHDDHAHGSHDDKPHETKWVVTLPLILLAIPSVGIGYLSFEFLLHRDFFDGSIFVSEEHSMTVLSSLVHHEVIEHPLSLAMHAFTTLPFWLAVAGVLSSWFLYLKRPDLPALIQQKFRFIYTLLDNKYYFDRFNDWFFAGGARGVSGFLWKFGDVKLIDGVMVNGSAKLIGMTSAVVRHLQSGYIYHYAFFMIIGVFMLLTVRNWFE